MKKTFLGLLGTVASFAPLAAFAQDFTYTDNVYSAASGYISYAVPILITIVIIVFIWMLVKYIQAKPEDKAKEKGGLIWASVAVFLALSIFGIVNVIRGITGTDGDQTILQTDVPHVQF